MLLVAAHNTVIHPQTLERIASLRQATAESPLLHAVDADQALKAFALTGSLARDLLVRVADATSLPKGVGQFTRLRLADVHATLVWDASERYLIIVDRLYAEFFRERLHHAAEPLDFHPSWAQAT
jgi:sarcosine oxidase gamma subunit